MQLGGFIIGTGMAGAFHAGGRVESSSTNVIPVYFSNAQIQRPVFSRQVVNVQFQGSFNGGLFNRD
jgi:hypothetical protein